MLAFAPCSLRRLPKKQYLDNFFAEGPQTPRPCFLPPLGRGPETCYVRTRRDIVLAVVRKKELLDCDDDAGLRTLKTTARPVRVEVKLALGGLRVVGLGLTTHNPEGACSTVCLQVASVLRPYSAVSQVDVLLPS